MTFLTYKQYYQYYIFNLNYTPCRVVILLWTLMRCGITCSKDPCHLQDAPGHGHMYGRNSHVSSCSVLSVCRRVAEQPEEEYLQGNMTVDATFSMARFLMLPEENDFTRRLTHSSYSFPFTIFHQCQTSFLTRKSFWNDTYWKGV